LFTFGMLVLLQILCKLCCSHLECWCCFKYFASYVVHIWNVGAASNTLQVMLFTFFLNVNIQHDDCDNFILTVQFERYNRDITFVRGYVS
jgi:hypothetical protein